MRDKFVTVVMAGIIIMIFSVLGLLGMIFFSEFQGLQTSTEPQTDEMVVGEEKENKYTYKNTGEENETEIQETTNSNVTTTVSSMEKNEKNIKVPQIVDNPLDQIKPENNTQNNNYTNVSIDRYFYNQLEDYSKLIYRAFESNKENMKTGNYQIEFGDAFSNLLRKSDGQNLLNTYYQSAIEAYIYDNPEVFYLNPNKMYLNIETITRGNNVSYNSFINSGGYANYLVDEFSSKQQINQAINALRQVRNSITQNKTGNIYNDVKMVHDYIINNTEYDTTISKASIYNIYGTLINKQAVCEGYAKSFKYLMDELGIQCILVIGKATNSEGITENHAWNYVKVDGKWYAIDTTWDDPISTSGWVSENSKYKYFLKGLNEMSEDHIPSGQFSEGGKIFNYPSISKENYK